MLYVVASFEEVTVKKSSIILFSLVGLWLSGCGELETETSNLDAKQASAIASFYNFKWAGEVYSNHCYGAEKTVDDQLLYTVGQLNGQNSVGRLDQVRIKDVETIDTPTGCIITYEATMPVAWGKPGEVPADYELILPRDLSRDGVNTFIDSYESRCLDWGAHDVDAGVFWYYYRPEKSICKLEDEDVFRFPIEVTASPDETEGMYPEYHKVWEDDALNVVAIFGKAKDGGGDGDIGVVGYGKFINLVKEELRGQVVETIPETLPNRAGVSTPEVTIRATLDDGKEVVVSVFLIEKVTRAPNSFWQRYESLTPTADYIIYNGHSGLGQNVRALARRGEWSEGQYSIVFMNGCDTFAYIDSALNDAHAEVNEDDPEGTKYLDIVANAMPSLFISMPEATMAIMRGLLSYDDPMTYEEILKDIDDYEVALVTGEHDNEYEPSMSID